MKLKKLLCATLAVLLLFSVASCNKNNGGNTDSGSKDEQVTLYVDLHSLRPSLSSTPTAENPDVVLATKYIIKAFEEENPNIKIKVDRTKDVTGDSESASQWLINKINNNDCPAIVFTWGTKFQDRNYYVDLTPYLEQPNEYVEGNTKWKDIFHNYVWVDPNVIDANDNIVAVPVLLSPGTQVAYYYNKNLFQGKTLPNNWETLISTAQEFNAMGKVGFAPWDNLTKVTLDCWQFKFSVGPSFVGGQMDVLDYNGDNAVTMYESIRGVKEGKYNPVTNAYARDVFLQMKRFFTTGGANKGPLTNNWTNPMSTEFTLGKVAMLEDGTWSIQKMDSNVDMEFEYGMMAPVLIDNATSQYALNSISYKKGTEVKHEVNTCFNIMKAAVKDKPEVLDAAIKFLKFLSSPDSIEAIVSENASYVPATVGSESNSLLDGWLSQDFPEIPQGKWPLGFIAEYDDKIDRLFQQWFQNKIEDEEFYEGLNEYQQKGADSIISSMNINTAGWAMQ